MKATTSKKNDDSQSVKACYNVQYLQADCALLLGHDDPSKMAEAEWIKKEIDQSILLQSLISG